MALNVPGLVAMILFYLLVLGIGVWASLKSKKMENSSEGNTVETAFLGNRGVSLLVGAFTMTATCVGGGFILGVAESVYDPSKGLVWALIPVQTAISFTIGGLFFAKPMREQKFVSMMDPFQRAYGKKLTAVLAVIPVVVEVIYVPGLLLALGATMSVILGLSFAVCVWMSAAVAIVYTMLGGLRSVAYTDVIQISLVMFSLWLCVPFVLLSGSYVDISKTALTHTFQEPWLGRLQQDDVGRWIDIFLIMTVGNMATQDFHQRTLSSSSTSTARGICFMAAGGVLVAGIPPVLVAAVAASTDWNSTSYGAPSPYERGEGAMIMPIVLQHFTPTFISALGVGALAAAVMSSADSFLLSASTVFTHNIYQAIRSKASDQELQWVIRLSIIIFGLVGTSMTHFEGGILVFWIVGSDLSFTIILPQMLCVLFTRVSNAYGAVAGYVVAVVMRLLCGEPLFGLPAVLTFPGMVPVKTVCMVVGLLSILTVSSLAQYLLDHVFTVKQRSVAAPVGSEAGDKEVSAPMLVINC
ncbi:high affinity choline transporter 1-like [Gouania willdenowi]|uniref:High affinity choline transporter 1-like n=1 Tax=Gouania willdenowi TaxID=441366 RepID=A0A8C5NH72_GOUWI|nr:high affinity choline transporter 1-like [Gouania willdenowi]